jgi:uncharacterized damage-inducible protein DinB
MLSALARYNRWMNENLYEVAAGLTDEDRKLDRGAFFRSIHGTFNHLLLADRVWLGRFHGGAQPFASLDASGQVIPVKSLGQELYADFEVLRGERSATDRAILEWVGSLSEAQLAAPFHYRSMNGLEQEHPLGWAALHFFNHQTHHRGQITTLLHQARRDPGVTDLLAMLRSEA